MAQDLRPLTLGEILDRTVQLYRRNFRMLVGIAFAPSLVAVGAWTTQILLSRASGSTRLSPAALFGVFFLIVSPLSLVAFAFAHAMLTAAAVDIHLGRPVAIRAVFRDLVPRYGRFLWLTCLQALIVYVIPIVVLIVALIPILLIGAIVGFGGVAPAQFGRMSVFLALPAILALIAWLLSRVALAVPVCWVEGKTAWASLKRSLAISKGARGKVAMAYVFFYAIAGILIALRLGVVGEAMAIARHGGHRLTGTPFLIVEIFEIFYSFATQVVVAPLASTAIAILYIDQRVRKEGFDIDWMMYQAGLHVPQTSPLQEGSQTAPADSSMPLAEPATVKEP